MRRRSLYTLRVTSFDRHDRLLAIGLSALAGYVDAVGFLATGGFFVSFMSGNSTRLGVRVAELSMNAAVAAALIGSFLIGVVAGSLIGRAGLRRRVIILLLLAVLLAGAAVLGDLGALWPAAMLMAAAMGVENIVFADGTEVRIGLTYMTGRLVKIGQMIAVALTRGERWGWVPHLVLWSGLIGGGAVGALAFFAIGADALWGAVGAALVIAAIASRPSAVAR